MLARSASSSVVRRLLIVSHVAHYQWAGRLHAYTPYAVEIDVWAELFAEIVIAAPLREEEPPADCTSFTRGNVQVIPQLETGGTTFSAKVVQMACVPLHLVRLAKAMSQADALHVRCPGNLGLLGAALGPVFRKPRVAKYAGQWVGFPGEAWTVRLQRVLLRSRWWGAPVTVYGEWEGQPPHVIPFFTSVLSEAHMARARRAAASRGQEDLLPRVLYVGRLSRQKNVAALLEALAQLSQRGIELPCTVVGDGPERAALQEHAVRLALQSRVHFTGALPYDAVLDHYEAAEILVLVSESEGWPKAVAEAMAFGLVCVASNRGLLPRMLENDRGLLVPPADPVALANALEELTASPRLRAERARRAADWSQRFSLAGLKGALSALLAEHWGEAYPRNAQT